MVHASSSRGPTPPRSKAWAGWVRRRQAHEGERETQHEPQREKRRHGHEGERDPQHAQEPAPSGAPDEEDALSLASSSEPPTKIPRKRGQGRRRGAPRGHGSTDLKKQARKLAEFYVTSMAPELRGRYEDLVTSCHGWLVEVHRNARHDLRKPRRFPTDPPFEGANSWPSCAVDHMHLQSDTQAAQAPWAQGNDFVLGYMAKRGWAPGKGLGRDLQGGPEAAAVLSRRPGGRRGLVSKLDAGDEGDVPEPPVWPPPPRDGSPSTRKPEGMRGWGKRLRKGLWWNGLWKTKRYHSNEEEERLSKLKWLRPFLQERGAADFFDWGDEGEGLERMPQRTIGGKTSPRWVAWYRLNRKNFPEHAARWSLGAWHGCPWYRVPKIARDERLLPGSATPAGVYIHKHGTMDKAIGYSIFQGIGQGILVLPLWEVALRHEPRTVRGDQWYVVPELAHTHIELVSLWIAVISVDNVPADADNFSLWAFPGVWRPSLEA